ncbi:hypothetical protein Ancab_022407 [Ancistrocladus abbreviatus]
MSSSARDKSWVRLGKQGRNKDHLPSSVAVVLSNHLPSLNSGESFPHHFSNIPITYGCSATLIRLFTSVPSGSTLAGTASFVFTGTANEASGREGAKYSGSHPIAISQIQSKANRRNMSRRSRTVPFLAALGNTRIRRLISDVSVHHLSHELPERFGVEFRADNSSLKLKKLMTIGTENAIA